MGLNEIKILVAWYVAVGRSSCFKIYAMIFYGICILNRS